MSAIPGLAGQIDARLTCGVPDLGKPGLDLLGCQGAPSHGPTVRDQLPGPFLGEPPFDQRLATELGVKEMHGDGLRGRSAIRERRDAEPPVGPAHERGEVGIINVVY